MIRINQVFDGTQREFILDLARMLYAMDGCVLPQRPEYLWKSQHPRERAILQVAEDIFEMLTGDSPDYSDDPDEL